MSYPIITCHISPIFSPILQTRKLRHTELFIMTHHVTGSRTRLCDWHQIQAHISYCPTTKASAPCFGLLGIAFAWHDNFLATDWRLNHAVDLMMLSTEAWPESPSNKSQHAENWAGAKWPLSVRKCSRLGPELWMVNHPGESLGESCPLVKSFS